SNFANCSVSGNRFAAAASCSIFFSIFATCSSGRGKSLATAASSFGVNSMSPSPTATGPAAALSGTDSALSFIVLKTTRKQSNIQHPTSNIQQSNNPTIQHPTRTPNTEHRTSNIEHRTSNTEHRTPNTEHRTPNIEL